MAFPAYLGYMALGSLMGGSGGKGQTSVSTSQSNVQAQHMTFNPSILNQIGGEGTLLPLSSTSAPVEVSPDVSSTASNTTDDSARRGVVPSFASVPSTDPLPDSYSADLTPTDNKGFKSEYIPAIVGIIAILIIGYVVLSGNRKLKR